MATEYKFIKPVQGYAYGPGDQAPLLTMPEERRAELVRLGYLQPVEVEGDAVFRAGEYANRQMSTGQRGRPKKQA